MITITAVTVPICILGIILAVVAIIVGFTRVLSHVVKETDAAYYLTPVITSITKLFLFVSVGLIACGFILAALIGML